MNSLEANIRENTTKGQLNTIRESGNVPGIIYGGKDENQKVSVSKKLLKVLIEKENFLSNIITLNVDGKPQNVLPREVKYHIISDEPTHVDFLRVLPGVRIKIEVPVNFINQDKSPGLKRVAQFWPGSALRDISLPEYRSARRAFYPSSSHQYRVARTDAQPHILRYRCLSRGGKCGPG